MKKRNKKEELEKEPQTTEKVEMENYWDVFVRNYRNVPGFKSLIKLIIYFVLIIIFILIASSATDVDEETKTSANKTSTTTVAPGNKNYKDLLDEILTSNKGVYIEVVSDEGKYIVDGSLDNGNMSGYYTTKDATKRFAIEQNKIYEVTIDGQLENMNLFANMNSNFIIQQKLIDILKNNVSTKDKKEDEMIYNYSILDNNIKYSIKVSIKDGMLKNIQVIGDKITYNISYK